MVTRGGEWVNLHAVAPNCEGSSGKEFVKIIMKLHCTPVDNCVKKTNSGSEFVVAVASRTKTFQGLGYWNSMRK